MGRQGKHHALKTHALPPLPSFLPPRPFANSPLDPSRPALLPSQINALILQGQWWRLMTPAFLHGNLIHLAVNCYSLNNLAPVVEGVGGGRRLLAVYLAAALAGNVASFYGSAAPSLGASGAVFGVGGALAVYFYRNKELYGRRADVVLNQLWQTLLVNLLFGLSNRRIDNW